MLKLDSSGGGDQLQVTLLAESINTLNGTVYIPKEKTVLIRAVSPPSPAAHHSVGRGGGSGGGTGRRLASQWEEHPPRPVIVGDGTSPLFRIATGGSLLLSNVILTNGRNVGGCGGGVVVVGEGLLVAQQVDFSANIGQRRHQHTRGRGRARLPACSSFRLAAYSL
jgi:hypothetical protein